MLRLSFAVLTIGTLLGCARDDDSDPAAADASPEQASNATSASAATDEGIRPVATVHLPNVVQVHPRVISGGLPASDAAFAELSGLGVKTIISVDGARPDVEAAARHGLRYVHLPHGYDGIPDERARELAKAVRELEGPVYIHCHHGKHRSPAAASVACVTAGLIEPVRALEILELAGTSRDYRGLYESADKARLLETALLEELEVEFREVAPVPPMADAMVQIEHTHEHLQQIAAAGWHTPADHPDLVPPHEALLLQEHFTELLRTDEVRQQPQAFRRMLEESETAARELTELLKLQAADPARATSSAELAAHADRIAANCKACHRQFRDNPLPHETPAGAAPLDASVR
jgi:protein tyrosine phosphatase (PTP) superfamily phosphohydrolase (DUF442 family)